MKITVDLELCQGHGQCEDAAPAVFSVSDDGFAEVHADEVTEPEAVDAVREAAARCPANAIVLTVG